MAGNLKKKYSGMYFDDCQLKYSLLVSVSFIYIHFSKEEKRFIKIKHHNLSTVEKK